MKNRLLIIIIVLLSSIFFSGQNSYGQVTLKLHVPDSGYVQILATNNGSTYKGKITLIEKDKIDFATDEGNLRIKISNIKSVEDVPLTAVKKGYWFPNPNNTRLYFAPKARTLKKGEGYLQNIYLFFGGVAYGVSDNITIGGGMSLFPGVDINDQVFFFTPKVGFSANEKLDLAVGALVVKLPDFGFDEDLPTAGIFYGVATYGGRDANITGGLGYGFVDGDLAEKSMLMLGFEKRFSRRTAFVSENWIFPGTDTPVISYGIRFFSETIAFDFAFLNSLTDFQAIGIPFIDFVYNF